MHCQPREEPLAVPRQVGAEGARAVQDLQVWRGPHTGGGIGSRDGLGGREEGSQECGIGLAASRALFGVGLATLVMGCSKAALGWQGKDDGKDDVDNDDDDDDNDDDDDEHMQHHGCIGLAQSFLAYKWSRLNAWLVGAGLA